MILVTGGTGFLGAHLLYHLTRAGKEVRVVKREHSSLNLVHKIFSYYSKTPDILLSKIEWVTGDVLDLLSLQEAFRGVKEVYHSAAVVSFESGAKKQMLHTNISGTANVVNVALEKNISKLCYVSSIAALGRSSDEKPITESTYFSSSENPSAYALSKYEAEREVWRGIHEGLNAVIVNPSVILGPGDWNTGSAKLFQTIYNGLKFYTRGVNGFVDVNDVANVMILLMESDVAGEQFLVNAEDVSYQHLFSMMAEALKVKPPTREAGVFLSALYWRLLALKSLLTGKKPTVTKETAQTAQQVFHYDNGKLLKYFDFQYMPIRESVNRATELFMKNL
ncbi:MAG: hypothetical protein DRJ09_02250 [Bacteroidetes bacterium]|nr:MAG: hypothetical protein DRJ09_02250 [Bacteroidota bacterium]